MLNRIVVAVSFQCMMAIQTARKMAGEEDRDNCCRFRIEVLNGELHNNLQWNYILFLFPL